MLMLQGRVAERDQIDQMLTNAATGTSSALLIHGEAGIGKTALLDYAAERADGVRVLRVEGIESEMELAFGGLHQLFLPVMDLLGRLPGPQAAAMRAAFGLTDGVVRDRFTIGLAVLTTLAEAVGEGRLLCLVDDAQWLDTESVDALVFAARRLQAEGVVMIFAVRDGTRDATVKGLPALRLPGLDREEAAALVAGLPPYVLDRIVAEAQGNPLAIIELSAALTPAQRAGRLSPLALPETASPPSGRIQDAFLAQIGRLPAATQAMLLVAAADDTGDLGLVLDAAGRFEVSIADLEPAEHAGLVFLSGETLRFRHPLIRYAAYRRAPLARRIAAHRALAETMTTPQHAHRRAWHLAAAATGPDEQVAAELERVARWAGGRQAMSSASAAYERAAQLTPDPGTRVRRRIAEALAAADGGQDERCGDLTALVTDPIQDAGVAADFARARAIVELGYGRPAASSRILLECADLIGADRPDKLPSLLGDALHSALSSGDAGLIADIAARGQGGLVMDVPARLFGGDLPGGLEALGDLVRAVREPEAAFMDLLLAAGYCHLVADHETAHELAAAAAAHCREHGIGGWLPTALHLLAQVELALGRHDEAAAHAAEGLRLADYCNLAHRAAYLRTVTAMLAAVRGDEEQARDLGEHALAYTRGHEVGRGAADALWALGLLELGAGRAEAALVHLESAGRQVGHPLPAMFLVPDLVEAAVRAGRPERAREPARLLEEWARTAGRPPIAALARRCRALIGPDEEAELHFAAAVQSHEGGIGFDRARTELLYGEWLRRMRRRTDARRHLREALETFERLGARPWARRARAELQATGEAVNTADLAAGRIGRLSPQEREVVRLAATGATNREIASQLFLSPRTVGHHLYRAFPKLGVSSRGELMTVLSTPS
ncbi:LuxR family transcriptional regulator [Planotetraspora kaengkrachanensis]